MKLIDNVVDLVSDTDKEEIQENLLSIHKTIGKEKHQNGLMRVLFRYWKKYIPQHKQSIDCGGCRKVVLQFWEKVNVEWNR